MDKAVRWRAILYFLPPGVYQWASSDSSASNGSLYLDEMPRRWAARYSWFRYTPVLSRPGKGWTGATGHVQHAALLDHPDLHAHRAYACGSEAMTTDAHTLLITRGGPPSANFLADSFVPAADPRIPA